MIVYEVKAGIGVIAGKTVSECLECEVPWYYKKSAM